jgi:hypothetical protein
VRLERLRKAGVQKLSRTDADSRFLRQRQFARRGLQQVAVEWALAATAFNVTRLWRVD